MMSTHMCQYQIEGKAVITPQLVCFDGEIEFQGPFLKKLTPRSIPQMSAFFSIGWNWNLKWPPGITEMSIKNVF